MMGEIQYSRTESSREREKRGNSTFIKKVRGSLRVKKMR